MSRAAAHPFHRFKVRLKREVMTMGQPHMSPRARVGRYVSLREWGALIDDPDTLLIDTRNEYEVAVGSFEEAGDPGTGIFQ